MPTRAGINLQRAGQTSFAQYPRRLGADTSDLDNRVLSLLLDKRGTLWVGSWNGLSRLAANANEFRLFHFGKTLKPSRELTFAPREKTVHESNFLKSRFRASDQATNVAVMQ